MSTAPVIVVTTDSDAVTLINVFTVDPDRQLELVRSLDAATASLFTKVEGFISANLHISLDGTKVINYAQWASEEAYKRASESEEFRSHTQEAASLAESFDPILVKVFATHTSEE